MKVEPPAVSRMRTGLLGGLLAGAAILGALVVFAHRDHMPVFEPDVGPPVGALLHLVVSVAWGWVFAVVAAPYRGLRVLGVAILTSTVAWAFSATVLPSALRYGNGLYASTPRAVIVHLLLAAGLASGMRLARR